MTDYVKSTNFASKDSLPSGNPLKIVKGTEIDAEFNNIATAVVTKADLNSPALIGTPTAPTASAGTNTTQLATTAFVTGAVNTATSTKAELNSPTFTGTPSAPTASVGTNTTQLATTAYVVAQVSDYAPTKAGVNATGTWGINISGNAATCTTASSIVAPTVTAGTLYQGDPSGNLSTVATTYTVMVQRRVYATGTVRVIWSLQSGDGTNTVYGRIYKNGTAVGTERSTTSGTAVTYTDDISVSSGDVLQLYLRQGGSGVSSTGNFIAIGTSANTPWPIVTNVRI